MFFKKSVLTNTMNLSRSINRNEWLKHFKWKWSSLYNFEWMPNIQTCTIKILTKIRGSLRLQLHEHFKAPWVPLNAILMTGSKYLLTVMSKDTLGSTTNPSGWRAFADQYEFVSTAENSAFFEFAACCASGTIGRMSINFQVSLHWPSVAVIEKQSTIRHRTAQTIHVSLSFCKRSYYRRHS